MLACLTRREFALAALTFGIGLILLFYATEPRRQERRAVVCFANLKRLGVAFSQYAQDYDDTFPRAYYGQAGSPSDAKANYKWMDTLFPYLKEQNLLTCPEDTQNAPYRFRRDKQYGSYVINNAYFSPGDNLTPPAGIELSRIGSPASVVLATDGLNDFQFAWPDIKNTPSPLQNGGFHLDSIHGRHYWHRWHRPLALDCAGSCSTAVNGHDFHKRTSQRNGQVFYPALTVEAD
ncbi:MAG TPA: DUF1559 domain-containing protein [Abditibacteriaceae bacterium]|jgi:hypothetical protein